MSIIHFQLLICIEHYLNTFKQKPGALAGSISLASSGYLKQLYADYFNANPRGFIDLLGYCTDNKITKQRLEESVKRLTNTGISQITTEKVKALLGNKPTPQKQIVSTQTTQMAKDQLLQATALMN